MLVAIPHRWAERLLPACEVVGRGRGGGVGISVAVLVVIEDRRLL